MFRLKSARRDKAAYKEEVDDNHEELQSLKKKI